MKKLLHLIDGSGYIFRAYYALRAMSTASGEPTNAVYGFATMIEKALREETPEYLVITFDAGGSNFRHGIYNQYKANRPPPPEDLRSQIPRIHAVAEAFRIKTYVQPGVEADDVIATLVQRARAADWDVRIITGDKDLMQLVDEHVTIFEPMRGERFSSKEVEEKMGVAPSLLADALALAGDASDNVPGVKGVGLKTAAKLLAEHGGLEGALAAAKAGKIKGKLGQSLVEHEADARLSRRLVTLKSDVALDVEGLEPFRYLGADKAKLLQLYTELEFRRLLPKLEAEAATETEAAPEAPQAPVMSVRFDAAGYRSATDLEQVRAILAEAQATGTLGIVIETVTERWPDTAVVGVALAAKRGAGLYVPLGHHDLTAPQSLRWEAVLALLAPVLADPAVRKVGVDLKSVAALAQRAGLVVRGLAFDSTLASYLLEPDEMQHGPVPLARRYFGHEPLDRATLIGRDKAATFSELSVEQATRVMVETADIALTANELVRPSLERAGVLPVLLDVELPVVPVLAAMELNGVKIDVERLRSMSGRFADELEILEKACYEAAGKEFNIGSPKQLQKILFEDLALKVIKRTKTGPSTDHSVLEALANEHPLPQAILDHRQVQKLKSTYVDALPKMVCAQTGRVHTHFSQSTAATGRLSSNDPNLQNIPIRTELGRELRKVFLAEPGNLLVSVDYSQIELRVLAHFSQDPVLTKAFLDNADVHSRTAAALFEIAPEAVTREQRSQAKAVNFGVLYGMGPVRLARDLKIPRRVATKFVADYFERQPGVRSFIERTLEDARKTGEVRTLLGRRRLVADINSQNRGARSAAERIATNTPIQGTAADLMKLAMIRVHAVVAELFPEARLLLQVHDELLLEVPEDRAETLAQRVKREMERVFPLDVPLVAEAHWGANWDAAH